MKRTFQNGLTAISLVMGSLLAPQSAHALITVDFVQQGSDVVATVGGSVVLTKPGQNVSGCVEQKPYITADSSALALCIGDPGQLPNNLLAQKYLLTQKSYTLSTSSGRVDASSFTGDFFSLFDTSSDLVEGNAVVGFKNDYRSGAVGFNTTTTWKNKSLTDLGITQTGVFASYVFADETSQQIELRTPGSQPPIGSVPGPVPLLGAGSAFAWSRRLRRRVAARSSQI